MTKTEFFKQHGGSLVRISEDNSEYGDFLILHPEEIDYAKKLEAEGCTIYSVHETEDGEDWIDEVDYGNQPFKYGYLATHQPVTLRP